MKLKKLQAITHISHPIAGIIFLLLLLVILQGNGFAAKKDLDSSRNELEAIRQRIGKTTRTLAEKKRAEKTANADLKKVEKSLNRMTTRVTVISSELAQLTRQIGSTESAMGQTGAEIEGLSDLVNRRIVALYKGGGTPLTQTIFTSQTATEISTDIIYWQRIVKHDRQLLGDYNLQFNQQNQNLRQLASLRQDQLRLKKEMDTERQKMTKVAKMKEDLLRSVRKDQSSLSRQLAELKGRAKRTDDLIHKLEAIRKSEAAAKGTSFSKQKGRLLWPVAGKVRIPFGNSRHPDLGTPYQSHGIEIEISRDLPVKSVWPGKVVFANAFKGYNNLLILDHGDGYYTLYAQTALLNCKVGDKIKRGQVVAQTDGSSGRFYFEIRKGGVPLDPKGWLE